MLRQCRLARCRELVATTTSLWYFQNFPLQLGKPTPNSGLIVCRLCHFSQTFAAHNQGTSSAFDCDK